MSDTVIDLAELANLRAIVGDDPALLAEFVSVFSNSVPVQVVAMRTAHSDGDVGSLRIAAHSFRSNARDIGARHLAGLCAILEDQCRRGELEDPGGQIEAIEAEAKRAVASLSTLDLRNV